MERLQGPLNSCFFGEHWEANYLEQQSIVFDEERLRLEEEEEQIIISNLLEDNMPFLQMLQSVEPSFQTLLRLQHMRNHNSSLEQQLESCVTHEMVHLSPVKSESFELQQQQNQGSASASASNSASASASCAVVERLSHDCINNKEPTTKTEQKGENFGMSNTKGCPKNQRKRKRTKPAKNKEDVENQRMTHIAVERNRRRQMNDHLSVLRSLMPPSYIQRGDQASIIGGAIDFVKELEQLLQSLEAQKRVRRKNDEDYCGFGSCSSTNVLLTKPSSSSLSPSLSPSPSNEEAILMNCGDEVKAEKNSGSAEIAVTLIQTHVNLKIQCQRKPGQLVKAIVALEDLRLSILHLSITSSTSEGSVLYSLNLKIDEGCKLRSANEIAEAVHYIFNFING